MLGYLKNANDLSNEQSKQCNDLMELRSNPRISDSATPRSFVTSPVSAKSVSVSASRQCQCQPAVSVSVSQPSVSVSVSAKSDSQVSKRSYFGIGYF